MKLLFLALAMVTLVAAKPQPQDFGHHKFYARSGKPVQAPNPGSKIGQLDSRGIEELKELLMELNEEKKEEMQAKIPYDAPQYKVSTKRSLYKRSEADCATICKPVHLPSEKSDKCTTKFAPEYEVVSGCECLKDYRCCPKDCKPADMDTCNVTTKGFGYFYPSKDVDCCGCEIVKCHPCELPVPKNEECAGKEFGDECYTYTMEAKHNDEDGCYRSICPINRDPKHPAPPCDTNCMTVTDGLDNCGYKKDTCNDSGNECALEEVIPATPLAEECYGFEPIVSVGYKHLGGGECEPCSENEANKKSCADIDKVAEDLECHQHGAEAYDKKCWEKTWDEDKCQCTTADCEAKTEECQEVFAKDEVCPKGHIKKSGVAICGQAREICIPCPTTVPKCDAYETVVDAEDADGCSIKRCKTVIIDNTGEGCDVQEFVVIPDSAGIFTITCHATEEKGHGSTTGAPVSL